MKPPIYEDKNPEKDLWGNVIDLPLLALPKSRKKIRRRAGISPGPDGETCGTCHHILTHDTGRQKFFKCGLVWNGGKSAASDIKKKNRSCNRWTSKTPKTNPEK